MMERNEDEWVEGTPGQIGWYKTLSHNGQKRPAYWASGVDVWLSCPSGSPVRDTVTHYALMNYPPAPTPRIVHVCEWLWGETVPMGPAWFADAIPLPWAKTLQEIKHNAIHYDALMWRIAAKLREQSREMWWERLDIDDNGDPLYRFRLNYGPRRIVAEGRADQAMLAVAEKMMETES